MPSRTGQMQQRPFQETDHNEEYSRELLEACPTGLVLYRPDGTLLKVNSAFASLLNRTPSETLHFNYWELTPTQWITQEQTQLAQLSEGTGLATYKKEFIRQDGRSIPVCVKATQVELNQESLIWASVEDLSAQKRQEKVLQKRYSLLQAILEGIGDAVFVKDLQGRYVMANSAYSRNMGKSVAEIIGKTDAQLWPGEVAQQFIEADRQVLSTGTSQTLEETIPANESVRTYLVTKSIWRDQGRIQRKHIRRAEHSENSQPGKMLGLIGIAREITERKQAEIALRESEKRYQTLIQFSPIGIFHTDATGRCFYVSERWCQIAGLTAEEAEGEGGSRAIHPEDRSRVFAEWQDAARTNTSFRSEYRFLRPDGRITWVFGQATAELNETGEIIGYVGTITDISNRKQVEEALRESERRFRAIFNQAFQFCAMLTPNGLLVEANQAALDFGGLQRSEVVGRFFWDTPWWRSWPETQERLKTAIVLAAEGQFIRAEFEMLGREATVATVDFSLKPVLDDVGNVIMLIPEARDITDRKVLERELALRQARFDAFFNAATAGLLILDTELRYVHINETLAELNGVSAAAHLGRTIREVLPELAPTVEPVYQAILRTGQPLLNVELSGETPKQPGIERHWVASSFPLFGSEGQAIGVGSVVIEITARIEAERALRLYQEQLEELVEARTVALSATMAQLQAEIAERQQAAEALQKSEARFRAIFDGAAVGIADTDLDGHFLRVNPKFCEIIGYSAEEVCALTFLDISHPDDLVKDLTEMQRLLNGEVETYSMEKRYCRKDGSLVWTNLTVSIVQGTAGEPAYSIAILHDISDRKALERELALRQARFDAFFVAAPAGLFILDEQLRYVQVNQALAELDGVPVVEHLGKRIPEILPELGVMAETLCHNVLSTGQPLLNGEISGETPREPGVEGHWLLSYFPLPGEAGPMGVGGVVLEITDRKRAEQALEQSVKREELLNRLASQIRQSLNLDMILETAVQQIRFLMQVDSCVFSWYRPYAHPPAVEAIHEAKEDSFPSLLGFHILELENPTVQQVLNLQIVQVENVETLEPRMRQSYQRLGIASALTIPIQTQSGDLGIINCNQVQEKRRWTDSEIELLQAVADQLAIAIDQARLYEQTRMTATQAQAQAQELEQTLRQLQHAQAQLIQSEKMSSLGELVAGVAHEINNPVNFIYGNLTYVNDYATGLLRLLELYQQEYPQPAPIIQEEIEAIELPFIAEDLPKILASMKVGTDRIRDIVLSLRNFSRLDEAEMKAVDIHEGLESTLLILQNRLKAKPNSLGIQVVKEYGSLPQVECYASQMNQVFMNLIANSIDALEQELARNSETLTVPAQSDFLPTVKICTEVKSITSEIQDENSPKQTEWAVIRISDNGPGMTEAVQSRLFDPFFTTKPIGKGTGLGLAICHSIVVEKHQGKIYCQSRPGEGAAFIVEIPVSQGLS